MGDPINTSRTSGFELPEEGKEIITRNSHFAARNVTYDALVLDGSLRQSLATVRSLGSRGLRVAALETFDSGGVPTFSSRWCQQRFVCPAKHGTEAYLTYLEQLLDHISVRVLIASSDGTIGLIRQHREQLERRVRIALAKEPALGIAINKERTLEVAKRLGVGVPRAVTVGAVSEVAAALHEIGLPAVVKPVQSWEWDGQQGTREIGLEGYSQVEFRRDAVGKPYLMEINPRLNLAIAHAVHAGVDFPSLLYQWASGEQLERVKSYRTGGWMRHLEGDIRATVAAVRQRGRPGVPSPARAIFDFCLSFFLPMKYDYVDWRDPLPAWTATKGFFAHYWSRLPGRRLSRRKSQ